MLLAAPRSDYCQRGKRECGSLDGSCGLVLAVPEAVSLSVALVE